MQFFRDTQRVLGSTELPETERITPSCPLVTVRPYGSILLRRFVESAAFSKLVSLRATHRGPRKPMVVVDYRRVHSLLPALDASCGNAAWRPRRAIERPSASRTAWLPR